jgi:hypothetical protein
MFAQDDDAPRFIGLGAHDGNGTQQELREMTEGGGFLTRNPALREEAKNLRESAVHAGGGAEVAAGRIEFGKIERLSDDVTSGHRVTEQLFLSLGVKAAAGGIDVRAGHGALAAIGEHKLATLG